MGPEDHWAHRAGTEDKAGKGESWASSSTMSEREHLPVPLSMLEGMGSEEPTSQGCSVAGHVGGGQYVVVGLGGAVCWPVG